MSTEQEKASSSRYLLARVARMHYLESKSKVEIAGELDLSRFKVARLLDEALTQGVVTITIDESGGIDHDLSERLAEHLGLAGCVVVEGRESPTLRREDVGGAAATLLRQTVREGQVVGMAWGRTITAMTEKLSSLPPVTVVALTGTVGSDLSESPVEAIRSVSARSGGRAHAIFAPLVLEDAQTAAALRRQGDIARAISYFDEINVAVLAVGSWNPPVSQLRDSLPPAEQQELEARGVVAEVAGALLTAEGGVLSDFADRCLSISSRQLARVPTVIAVAAEPEKTGAVFAVAKSNLVSHLVTDRLCAEQLLELPLNPRRPRR